MGTGASRSTIAQAVDSEEATPTEKNIAKRPVSGNKLNESYNVNSGTKESEDRQKHTYENNNFVNVSPQFTGAHIHTTREPQVRMVTENPDGETTGASNNYHEKNSERVPLVLVESVPVDDSKEQTNMSTESGEKLSDTTEQEIAKSPGLPTRTTDAGIPGTDEVIVVGDPYESMDRCLELIGETKNIFTGSKKTGNMDDLRSKLVKLKDRFFDIAMAPPIVSQPLFEQICDDLIKREVDEMLFALVMDSFPKTCNPESGVSASEKETLTATLDVLLSFTDVCTPLSIKVVEKPGLLETLAEALLYHGVFLKTWESEDGYAVGSIGIVYNCSLRYANRKRLRDVGFVWILKRVMRSDQIFALFTATIALAGILDEEESKFFQSEIYSIAILVTLFNDAVTTPHRRSEGFSAKGLATACSRLAGNDVNKQILVVVGMLDCLLALCDVGDPYEQKEALSALWALAFDDTNKEQMLQTTNLVYTLMRLRESPDEAVQTEATNTLWTLGDKLRSSSNPEFQKLGEDLSTIAAQSSSSEDIPSSGKHIMISYSWDNKTTVFKLHEELERNGYRVWIDRNEMKGSIIDSIADGVENADVMLICISLKYKTSKYCRAEAEYAFTRDIQIIPLLMESDFKADGWLGLIKGAKKHFDFGQSDYFDVTFPTLIKELGQNGKGSVKTKPIDEPDTAVKFTSDASTGRTLAHMASGHGTVVVSSPSHHVINWSAEDVHKWLQDNDCHWNSLQKMTGQDLLFLMNLKTEAPEFFYIFLRKELKLKGLNSFSKFVQALTTL